MSLHAELRSFTGFLTGLPAFVRERITPEAAQAAIRQRMQAREANFLTSLTRGVFSNQRSPYRALMHLAGCTRGDIEEMVRTRGIEETLVALRDAGVYITFEEFKANRPIVRAGRTIETRPEDFDNPYFHRYFHTTTAGSTGTPRRVLLDIDYLRGRIPQNAVLMDAQGLGGAPLAQWAEIPPGHGLEAALMGVTNGNVLERWFTPIWKGPTGPGARFRVATSTIVATANAFNARLPQPEFLPLDRADVIVRWAEQARARAGRCVIRAHVSKAVRIALAAHELSVDLSGVTISSGGEPPTPTKVQQITTTGARFLANYFFMEAGPVGFGCPNADSINDQHLVMDHLALITGKRELPSFGVTVDAFYYTTLLSTAPKLMLNVETDDYGHVDQRSCGCSFESLGYTTHLHDIRSFSKLTGEGVTLIGTDMERILEHTLPERFGGGPLDYQLVEEEDERGLTRLTLLIHPNIPLRDEQQAIDVVHTALRTTGGGADIARAIWSQAGTVRVRREPPRLSARGKHHPLLSTRRPTSTSVQARGSGHSAGS